MSRSNSYVGAGIAGTKSVQKRVKKEVELLCEKFPLYPKSGTSADLQRKRFENAECDTSTVRPSRAGEASRFEDWRRVETRAHIVRVLAVGHHSPICEEFAAQLKRK